MKQGKDLDRHLASTFFSLRRAVAVLAIALPLVVAAGGYLACGLPLQESLSAYYGTCMRDLFVAFIIAIGACLHIYKGFSDEENILLNCAGVLAAGIALFPWNWEPWGKLLTPHGICAILFFASMAIVCLRHGKDSLQWTESPEVRARFERRYTRIGYALIASPAIAYAIHLLWPERSSFIFFAEAVAIAVFASYWVTKSQELALTTAEREVVERANTR